MENKINIDNKGLNKLIKISNKILKNINFLIVILIAYVSILIIMKLNIVNFILTFFNVLSPLFIGILIAWLLRPIVNYIENHNINRLFALIVIYILFVLIVIILFTLIVPNFIIRIIDFIKVFPNLINGIFDKIYFIDIRGVKSKLLTSINDIILNLSKTIPDICSNILKILSNIFIGFIIGFYLLISNSVITINTTIKKDTFEFIMKSNNILRNYVKGTILSSFIVFILTSIIFYLLKLDNFLLFGFICGITNIVPFIGPYIGAILPCVVAFTKNITFGIITLVMIFIIQTIEANIIQPIIMSKSINIHPILSIIGVLIFGYFFGIYGMIFAVPVIAIFKELYLFLEKKLKFK